MTPSERIETARRLLAEVDGGQWLTPELWRDLRRLLEAVAEEPRGNVASAAAKLCDAAEAVRTDPVLLWAGSSKDPEWVFRCKSSRLMRAAFELLDALGMLESKRGPDGR